jgi:hypothetical protein
VTGSKPMVLYTATYNSVSDALADLNAVEHTAHAAQNAGAPPRSELQLDT